MSQAISSSVDCCTPCEENPSTSIPGTPGDDGDDGDPGAAGENAFTTLTLAFTMPALGASDTATVVNTGFLAVNQKVFLGVGASRGWFEVVAILTPTTVTLKNVETATEYTDNSPPTTVFAVGAKLVPGGLQGPSAAAGAGVLLSANNLADVTNAATSLANLGAGTAAVLTAGVANGNLPTVNDAGGLTNGESVWATATGLESKTAALARTGLGLVLGIADTQIPPINDAAGIIAGEVLFATAAGIESKTAAATLTALGVGIPIVHRSADVAFTAVDTVVITNEAHTLLGAPDLVQILLVNKANTASLGYAVGDIIPLQSVLQQGTAIAPFSVSLHGITTFSLYCTNVAAPNFSIHPKNTAAPDNGVTFAELVADWNLRVVLIRYS